MSAVKKPRTGTVNLTNATADIRTTAPQRRYTLAMFRESLFGPRTTNNITHNSAAADTKTSLHNPCVRGHFVRVLARNHSAERKSIRHHTLHSWMLVEDVIIHGWDSFLHPSVG